MDGTDMLRPSGRWIASALLATAIAAVGLIVFLTNGTSNVFLHAMYVPIIAASLLLGTLGGVLVAVAGAVALGPLMPLNVELGLAQPVANTAYRGLFFVLVALTTAGFAGLGRRRMRQLAESRTRVGDLLSRNLRLFARLVAERDEQTGGHCERVALNAQALGRVLGLPATELHTAYWAGVLHDLGKLGVPEAILRKPGRLTSEEFRAIQAHPAYGERMLLDISHEFDDIARAVRSHHERWDGGGYPDRLAGDDIPMIGRILAVVDVFEAITSQRPYRGPMPHAEARRLIREGMGSHFDPRVAAAFLDLEEAGAIVVEGEPAHADREASIVPTDSGVYPAPVAAN